MFLQPDQRAAIEQEAAASGVKFLGVWLTAPRETLKARLVSRTGDASDASVGVLEAVAQHDRGGGDWVAIDASDAVQALSQTRHAIQTRIGSHIQWEVC